MTIARGRAFAPAHADEESDSCIINEAAAKMFGWDDPIGRTIVWSQDAIPAPRRSVRIVGVVKDFYDRSLRSGIRPFMLRVWRPWYNFIIVKVDKNRVPLALAGIKEAFQKFAPDYTFDYEFLDEYFERQYAVESQQGRLFNAFGALSLAIASLGLFGLAAYAAERRTKEIGKRKSQGSEVGGQRSANGGQRPVDCGLWTGTGNLKGNLFSYHCLGVQATLWVVVSCSIA